MVNFLKDFSEEDITYSLYGLLLGDGCYKKDGFKIYTQTSKNFIVNGLNQFL